MKKFSFLGVLTLFILVTSCNGGKDPSPDTQSFEIFLDFWNTTGRSPEVRFDELKTSREIKIDFSKTFGGQAVGSNFTNVIIDNFRIIDQNSNNYNIEKITAFEFRDNINDWKEDVEFTMDFGQSDDISVVLVLDRSESLGADFKNVQTYATNFVDKIFAERKSVKMGVVDFADDINSFPITANSSSVKTYINGLQQGRFTTLYEAMDIGIDMLQDDDAQSKVLIVFTDGTDNNSKFSITPDFLLNKIRGDNNTYKISTFTIGLEGKGGIDKVALQKLVANGGVSEFPQNVTQLQQVFEKFSKVISNVYNLTYTRNQQAIPRNQPAKLKFVIQTTR
ncbi:MAG: VWA domain-containing protein [Spirosomaceae bacterium]|nr:VWA domain-containing protein [Spirosomataceae bacterium]